MYNVKNNQWAIPELGLLNIPEHLQRQRDGWAIETDKDTWWVWRDVDHGHNYMDSLREAGAFAVTIGSLPTDEARAANKLLRQDRLTQTGVLGVFFRSGLKQAYHVIIDGQDVAFPYNDGKGFTAALRGLEKLISAETREFVRKADVKTTIRLA